MNYSDLSPLANVDNDAEASRLVRGEPHSFASVVVAGARKESKIGRDICLYLATTTGDDSL